MEAIDIVIACIVNYILALNNALLYRFKLVRRIGTGSGVFVRHNEMHILVDNRIAVRTSACDKALKAVTADHSLPPRLCLICLFVGKLCVRGRI